MNLLNAWRDDGEPSLGFLDCLLPNVDMTPVQIGLALSLREYLLKDPYDYTISRSESGAEVQLLEEQGFTVGGKKGVFRVEKDYVLAPGASSISVKYTLSNSTYMDSKCFFGTIFELGLLGKSGGRIVIDGFDLKWDGENPLIYPEAKEMKIQDFAQGCVVTMKFDSPASVFVGPVFGASSSAAPEVYQGLRIYPFWRTALTVMDEKKFGISVSVSGR